MDQIVFECRITPAGHLWLLALRIYRLFRLPLTAQTVRRVGMQVAHHHMRLSYSRVTIEWSVPPC